MSSNIDGYNAQAQKVDLEMSVEEADRIIDTYLEKTENEKEEEQE